MPFLLQYQALAFVPLVVAATPGVYIQGQILTQSTSRVFSIRALRSRYLSRQQNRQLLPQFLSTGNHQGQSIGKVFV